MILAIAALPMMLLTGAAIDYSRAADLQSRLQAGTDSATLLLCQSSSISTTTMKSTAQSTIAPYMPNLAVSIDQLTYTASPRAIQMTTSATYPMMFMQIGSNKSIPLKATAACSSGQVDYEIALVLDTTGSMSASSGSQSKLQAMQSAATDFVNYLFDTAPSGHLRISLVPFAASVKVDPTAYANASWIDSNGRSSLHWQNVTGATAAGFKSRLDVFRRLSSSSSGWGWGGCLESLPFPLNVQDGAPTPGNLDSYYVPLFAPDEIDGLGTGTNSVNTYVDDGTALVGTCGRLLVSTTTRMGQACKYQSPTNPQGPPVMSAGNAPGPNFMCTSRALTRLTTSRSTLLSEIGQLSAAGSTNIHEGVMWGWRTLSPNSVFADGSNSTATTVVKAIVVMTDGENTWTGDPTIPITGSYYSAYGYFRNVDGSRATTRLPSGTTNPTTSDTARAAVDALTAQACTNAKTSGKVAIYTIGFSVPSDPIDSAGQTLLRNCASSTDKFFLANDGSALQSAFSSIARGIGKLRLTQ